jgi:hypothetical protein
MRSRYWYSSCRGVGGVLVDSDCEVEDVVCFVGSECDMTGSSAEGAILCVCYAVQPWNGYVLGLLTVVPKVNCLRTRRDANALSLARFARPGSLVFNVARQSLAQFAPHQAPPTDLHSEHGGRTGSSPSLECPRRARTQCGFGQNTAGFRGWEHKGRSCHVGG